MSRMTLDSGNNGTDREHTRKKYLTMFGLYNIVKGDLIPVMRKEGFPCINYTKFAKAVKLYFSIVFRKCIEDNVVIPFKENMGCISVVKTLCTKYNPQKLKWKTVDGKRVSYVVKYDVNKTDGFFYFMLWELPSKFNWYKFHISPLWKKRIFYKVINQGHDYIDKSIL